MLRRFWQIFDVFSGRIVQNNSMSVKKYNHISLFYPYVTKEMKQAVYGALGQKMITQGKTVAEFEKKLGQTFNIKNVVALNNCTAALELAYHLMDFRPKDEVITPVFTCTATNLLLLRRGVKIIFTDIKEDMLLDWTDVERKITPKTKAVINVHLFNQLSEARNLNVPIIGDAAQYLAKTFGEKFTAYSFQATKTITTVDGGILVCSKSSDYRRAKLLRWYGIDRETDKDNIDIDIFEAGYKYHMNNVTAAMGLAALPLLPKIEAKTSRLEDRYFQGLKNIPSIKAIGGSPFLIHAKKRTKLINHLAQKGIQTGLGHRRNDLYTIFGGKRLNLPNMNRFEKTYLLLPCRANMDLKDVNFICQQIRRFYVKA